MPEPKLTLGLVKVIAAVVVALFTIFFFMDTRHAHPREVESASADLNQRILMAESTRYAEVANYYTNKLREGETLTKAEESRLDLVQRQQERISGILKGKGE